MGLRAKVLSGFLILALMLSIAGVWSIHELRSTSSAVGDLLAENYRSINAGRLMLEALEREDSGVLLLLLGRRDDGRAILAAADSMFRAEYGVAAGNITLSGEAEVVAEIDRAYRAYRDAWSLPIADTAREGDLAWYLGSAHGAFGEAKDAVSRLVAMNNRAMYDTASGLRQGADRAVMPGIVAIAAALVFSLLFSYFVNLFMVDPIVRITRAVGRLVREREAFDVRLEARDELAELADSIRQLAAQVPRNDADAPGVS